jgi:hypothetical protein
VTIFSQVFVSPYLDNFTHLKRTSGSPASAIPPGVILQRSGR